MAKNFDAIGWIIYQTLDTKTSKIYVGQHHCSICWLDGDCGYRGSGILIKKIFKKRSEALQRTTLIRANSQGEANFLEIASILELDATNPEIGYNISPGGNQSFSTIHSEGQCKIHGKTIFLGNTCNRCLALANISYRECPLHGILKPHAPEGACLVWRLRLTNRE